MPRRPCPLVVLVAQLALDRFELLVQEILALRLVGEHAIGDQEGGGISFPAFVLSLAHTAAVQSTLKLVDDPSWNHRITVVAGVMAEECRGLLQEFFREKRRAKSE